MKAPGGSATAGTSWSAPITLAPVVLPIIGSTATT